MHWTHRLSGQDETIDTRARRVTRRERVERQARQVDVSFKVVRFGLNFVITVLLLLGFCLLYVRPGDAVFYVVIMTFPAAVGMLCLLLWIARRARREYAKTMAEEPRRACGAENGETP